jgi:hypothetical protein
MTRLVWDAILRHYDMHHRPRVEQEHAWFAKSASIEEAISRAALATDERGKRFHHQRRIPRRALETARDELLQHQEEIRNAADFDALLAIITHAVGDVHRTGELYAYDTALRISYYLDLLPRVYLHAGTRAGARALHLPHNNESINANDLPPALRHRPAHEVEDILCIYKEHFTSE